MKYLLKNFFILILFIVLFLPSASFAAEIFFNSGKNVFSERQSFLAEIFMDTEGAQVNAVEGTIIFSDQMLQVKEIRDGNSSLNFWVDKPEERDAGKISFSGITAGGFSGTDRFLLGIVFETKGPGAGSLGFNGTQALLNDGLGTKTDVEEISFDFTVSPSAEPEADLALLDTGSPESFNPLVAKDPTLFDGKYFIVWSTVDKGTGIDHYEMREGFWADYEEAESPYLLGDQSLRKNIYIKAVDRAGNEKLAKVKAQYPYWRLGFWPILILLIVCAVLFRKLWTKFVQR